MNGSRDLKKLTTLCTFQSFTCLLKTMLQPWGDHNSVIVLCCWRVRLYMSGYNDFKMPFSCQLSSQKLVLVPSKTFILEWSLSTFHSSLYDFIGRSYLFGHLTVFLSILSCDDIAPQVQSFRGVSDANTCPIEVCPMLRVFISVCKSPTFITDEFKCFWRLCMKRYALLF